MLGLIILISLIPAAYFYGLIRTYFRLRNFKRLVNDFEYKIILADILGMSHSNSSSWINIGFAHPYSQKNIDKLIVESYFGLSFDYDRFTENLPVICFSNGDFYPLLYHRHIFEYNIVIDSEMEAFIPFY